MKICLYQGTFNPIHNAHIEVAKYVKEHFDFEKITFVPAFKPPHKDLAEFTADNAIHRLNMIQLAIEDYPYFDIMLQNATDMNYTYNNTLYGASKYFDKLLTGVDGYTIFQKDRTGYKIAGTNSITQEAVNGNDVHLTIDNNIQFFVDEAIKKTSSYS